MSGSTDFPPTPQRMLLRLFAVLCETAPAPLDVVRFLDDFPSADSQQLREVLLFDQFYRWRFDQARPCEWYFEKLPTLFEDNRQRATLVREEISHRHKSGTPLDPTDCKRRFPDLMQSHPELFTPACLTDPSPGPFVSIAEAMGPLYHGGSFARSRFGQKPQIDFETFGESTPLPGEDSEPETRVDSSGTRTDPREKFPDNVPTETPTHVERRPDERTLQNVGDELSLPATESADIHSSDDADTPSRQETEVETRWLPANPPDRPSTRNENRDTFGRSQETIETDTAGGPPPGPSTRPVQRGPFTADTSIDEPAATDSGGTSLTSLPPDVLRLVESHMQEREFAAGEYLMKQGDDGDSLMAIVSGTVEVTTSSSGKSQVIARVDNCQVLGEMALVTSERRSANVIAHTDVTAMVLPASEFHQLAQKHPSISLLLTAIIAQRLGRAAQADVLWGKTLGVHYRITGRLGRGGMAVVYSAVDERNGRHVALKMMSHRLVYDTDALAQFQLEADLIEAFDHPHIARMHGRFEAFHTFFTVIAFCDGVSLRDLLYRNGPLPEDITRAILGQVASALMYAHERNVIHRDVKPGNIMLSRDGNAVLLDFGLAKNIADAHPSLVEQIVGTPQYMAPEQILGTPVSPATDYFSFGCVAWEMLTGEPLLPEADWIGLLRHHAGWDESQLDSARDNVDPGTYELLCNALRPQQELRTLSLAEVATWAGPVDTTRLRGFS